MLRFFFRQLIVYLIFPAVLLSLTLQPVHAELIATGDAVSIASKDAARAKVAAFMKRQEVQQIMHEQGVNVDEAQQRIMVMSDAEVLAIARHIDRLPAGGDAVGAVIGAAVLIFIVLLVTDLLGLTHVFPFVKR